MKGRKNVPNEIFFDVSPTCPRNVGQHVGSITAYVKLVGLGLTSRHAGNDDYGMSVCRYIGIIAELFDPHLAKKN